MRNRTRSSVIEMKHLKDRGTIFIALRYVEKNCKVRLLQQLMTPITDFLHAIGRAKYLKQYSRQHRHKSIAAYFHASPYNPKHPAEMTSMITFDEPSNSLIVERRPSDEACFSGFAAGPFGVVELRQGVNVGSVWKYCQQQYIYEQLIRWCEIHKRPAVDLALKHIRHQHPKIIMPDADLDESGTGAVLTWEDNKQSLVVTITENVNRPQGFDLRGHYVGNKFFDDIGFTNVAGGKPFFSQFCTGT